MRVPESVRACAMFSSPDSRLTGNETIPALAVPK